MLLAKRLLNPADSVLIVTIDEKEYLRLGLLLEQTFSQARITMVTASINPGSSTRKGTFGRSAEYIYFVQVGESKPTALELGAEWNAVKTANKADIHWDTALRTGTGSLRTDSPNLLYPVFIRQGEDGPVFHSIGEVYRGTARQSVVAPEGCVAVWPLKQNGLEGRWQVNPALLRSLIESGHARLGPWKADRTAVYYLKAGERKKVDSGLFAVIGRRPDGSVVTDGTNYRARFIPNDMWRLTAHDAGKSGSRLLGQFLPGRYFPFAKSLYAVEDALRFFVASKPNALILDFFAGSGTTAQAVMRLNRQYGGARRSICVTNNEVGVAEQSALRASGLKPGDEKWEALGICDYITKPRIRAAITGIAEGGAAISGNYRFGDEFPMSDGFFENAEFFTLSYEDSALVSLGRRFNVIAPLLWLRAGARGQRIDEVSMEGWSIPASACYGVLFDTSAWGTFVTAAASRDDLTHAFIVTDSLVEYLRSFEINVRTT